MEGHNTYTSSLRLVLPAQELWDSQGRLQLRCSAEIPGLFRESDVLELHNPELRRAQLSGLFAAGGWRMRYLGWGGTWVEEVPRWRWGGTTGWYFTPSSVMTEREWWSVAFVT